MKITSIIAIYILFWALSFFLVLPFRLQAGQGDDVRVPGQADSAPPNFSFKRTSFWTTIVAAILFALFYLNYVEGWIGASTFDIISGTTR